MYNKNDLAIALDQFNKLCLSADLNKIKAMINEVNISTSTLRMFKKHIALLIKITLFLITTSAKQLLILTLLLTLF